MRETHIMRIELPGHLEIPYEQVSEEVNIRQYVAQRTQGRKVLPGEIRLECLSDQHDGWVINVFEVAELPADA